MDIEELKRLIKNWLATQGYEEAGKKDWSIGIKRLYDVLPMKGELAVGGKKDNEFCVVTASNIPWVATVNGKPYDCYRMRFIHDDSTQILFLYHEQGHLNLLVKSPPLTRTTANPP